MPETEATELNAIQISSWAAPTRQDMAILESLTDRQYQALLKREIQKGFESGVSVRTMDDVWNEAVRRAKAAACAPDAL